MKSFTEADAGRWVTYRALPDHTERGRIKSWSDKFICQKILDRRRQLYHQRRQAQAVHEQ